MKLISNNVKRIFSRYVFFEIYLLGIISGMPYSVMYTAIVTWLTQENVDIAIISSFALTRTPYAFKYLWAPLLDYTKIPLLYKLFGRRRSWMVLTCILNSVILFTINTLSLTENLYQIWLLAICFGFSAATYDIAYDALRIEKLPDSEQSLGATAASFGYKTGAYISGAGVMIFVSIVSSWGQAFNILSTIFILGLIFICTVRSSSIGAPRSKSFVESVTEPLKDIFSRDYVALTLLLIVTFKGGQCMLNFMSNPFYLKVGYSLSEIALVVKSFGIFMSMIGIFIGGVIIKELGVYRGIVYCGILQALSDFSFIWLHHLGPELYGLYINIILENVTGGMGSCALVTFISVYANKKYAGTHFALLSSFAVMLNSTITGFAGSIVNTLGWDGFFLLDFAISIPPLFIAYYLSFRLSRK